MSDSRSDPLAENWLFSRLPKPVVGSLTHEQAEALREAVDGNGKTRHPVHLRFTLPLGQRRYFFNFVVGSERRTSERLAREREHYPLRTAGNFFFVLGIATLFYLLAFFAFAFYSAIIEF